MKKENLCFVCIFIIIISLPLVLTDTKSTVSKKENRMLAAAPQFIVDGTFNINVLHGLPGKIDDYINDRAGFRNEAVRLDTFLNINVFGKKYTSKSLQGKNGFLFYIEGGDNFNDFLKLNLFNDSELKQSIKNLEDRAKWCEENGIKFIFFIGPNKHNVYPEYYPFERPKGITRTEQFLKALPDDLKGKVVYPLDYIISKKTDDVDLYYEKDTHWNMLGAFYAYQVLLEKLKTYFPGAAFPSPAWTKKIHYETFGDINMMIGLVDTAAKSTFVDIEPVGGWQYKYEPEKKYPGDEIVEIITINADSTLPSAIIYRDSFFVALQPLTSNVFSHADYIWHQFNSKDKEYVLANKPDIVIWEIVERFMIFMPQEQWE